VDFVGFFNSPAFLWTVLLLELVIIFWLIFRKDMRAFSVLITCPPTGTGGRNMKMDFTARGTYDPDELTGGYAVYCQIFKPDNTLLAQKLCNLLSGNNWCAKFNLPQPTSNCSMWAWLMNTSTGKPLDSHSISSINIVASGGEDCPGPACV